jgi:hypothetical protein
MKPLDSSAKAKRLYTPQDIDILFAHIERLLNSKGGRVTFPVDGWQIRIRQAFAT